MSKKRKKPHKTPVPRTTTRYRLMLEMESDWHVGTGAGIRGYIDSLIARDHRDLPCVPAKTVTGILRDGCEMLAFGLDHGRNEGPWSRLVTFLFGEEPSKTLHSKGLELRPLPAALSIRPAFLEPALADRLTGNPAMAPLRQALTFLKPGVAIDRDTGTAADDMLRIVEMARAGAMLEANAELEHGLDQTTRVNIEQFLACGAALSRKLGGDRRRGAGACRVKLQRQGGSEIASAAAAEALTIVARQGERAEFHAAILRASDQRRALARSSADLPNVIAADGQGLVVIPVALALDLPVSAPRRVAGNVNETLDYIPGTYLIGPVRAALAELGFDAAEAIHSGALQVSNFTIDVDGSRGLAMPFALAVDKLAGKASKASFIYNTLLKPVPDGIQGKQLRSGFVRWVDRPGAPLSAREPGPEYVVQTHNTINDSSQRPVSAEGGVYSIEALQRGQVLRGEVRARPRDSATVEQALRSLIGQPLRLGRAKKDDYGLARIMDVGTPGAPRPSQPGSQLVVWCLSDVLLSGLSLGAAATRESLRGAVAALVGLEAGQLRDPAVAGGLRKDAIRTKRIDDWHAGWGLPRPSLVGIAAGSCVVYEFAPEVPAPDPIALGIRAAEGIGERRAEGYGEIALNPPLLMRTSLTSQAAAAGDVPVTTSSATLGGATLQFARTVERDTWRRLILDAVARKAVDPTFRKKYFGLSPQVSMSQIGGMRSAFLRMLSSGKSEPVLTWLRTQKLRAEAGRAAWGHTARSEITKLVATPEELIRASNLHRRYIWEMLSIADDALPNLTPDGGSTAREALKVEAIVALVETCVHHHARQHEPSPAAANDAEAT